MKGLFELLEQYGETPLPHYLEGAQTPEHELRQRYQSIFAKGGTSVAAPTASLHFTEGVFDSFTERDIKTTQVLLNVGLGTFSPLKEENFLSGRLHSEYASVDKEAAHRINDTKTSGRSIVAVGTTVTRTLESFGRTGAMKSQSGKTDIFIFPPYQFRMVDVLITNFHLPETSLMLLVDAFLQHKGAKRDILSLYEIAMEERFSFYSFGDSMLIL